ncbi:MAG: hypothetical protein JWP59_435 [Massilia sp.]|nr:hypothetical protein [Massilia sp.]
MKRTLTWLVLWLAVLIAPRVFGQAGAGAPPSEGTAAANRAIATAFPGASSEAGRQLAASGAANGVTACTTCHGAQGEGNAAANFPRIAGQSAYYFNKQMDAFANGARDNPIMSPIAKAMTAQQRRDTSVWYASLQAPSAPTPAPAPAAANAANVARGRVLAGVGDESKQLQACANCHGPGGRGEAPGYPYLAAQHAGYLQAVMGEWKSGLRKTDNSGQMQAIARRLSDTDVAALAAFYAAQAPPPPAALAVNIPAGSSARPAIAAAPGAGGPKAAGAMPSGVGSEQGAGLTGGAQGPGGGGGTQATQPGQQTGQPGQRQQPMQQRPQQPRQLPSQR